MKMQGKLDSGYVLQEVELTGLSDGWGQNVSRTAGRDIKFFFSFFRELGKFTNTDLTN